MKNQIVLLMLCSLIMLVNSSCSMQEQEGSTEATELEEQDSVELEGPCRRLRCSRMGK